MHAEAIFRVVFEEGVRPSRSLSLAVLGIWHGRGACAVDGGAAGRIGDHHAVAEETGDHIDVRGLAAACAGTGEFEVGRFEHGASEVLFAERIVSGREALCIVPKVLLGELCLCRLHDEGFLRSRAGIRADAAAVAVFRIDDDAVLESFDRASEVFDDEAFRRIRCFVFGDEEWTDGSMRADDAALVTADTVFRDPFRDHDGCRWTFVLGGAGREGAVFDAFPGGNREVVAFLTVHDVADVLDEVRTADLGDGAAGGRMFPFRWHFDFDDAFHTGVDSFVVHVDDVLAFSAVGFFVGVFQVFHGICIRNDVGEVEEGRLHDHIDAAAETDVLCDLKGIDDVEFCLEGSELPFHGCRQDAVQIFFSPWGVQKEDAARLEAAEKVVFIDVGRTVAGDVVSLADEVRLSDRIWAEAKMGDGDAAGFLGVIGEVALCIEVGVVADDLDGALVRTDGAVRAEAPEFAGDELGRDFRYRERSEGEVRHVVFDGEREVVARGLFLQVFIDSHDVFRNDVLRA